jgi:hypothetical protein
LLLGFGQLFGFLFLPLKIISLKTKNQCAASAMDGKKHDRKNGGTTNGQRLRWVEFGNAASRALGGFIFLC